jgi:tetratricopeptide (TPR) repeat protein
MIAKNEAHTLEACLKSVQGVVSQIVVADTGSTDNTREIAHAFGATVISVPWENHYAKARNAALKPMKTDWVLVLDADEELDGQAKHSLLPLLKAPKISGYMLTIRDYMPGKASYYLDRFGKANDRSIERAKNAASYHDQQTIRLFRRNPDVYYFGRVHELVEYRICSLGLKYVPANILIHHFGHLRGQEVRERKNLLYRELGQLKVKEESDNPFAWFELGLLEHQAFGNSAAALQCFQQVVRLHPPFVRAWLFIAMIEIEMNQPAEALATLSHAEGTDEAAALRERLKGDALHNLGRMAEARTAYQLAAKLGGDDPLVESKLGYTEVRLGDPTGFEKLRRAAEALPQNTEVCERLIKAHIITGNLSEAAEAAEWFAGNVGHPKTFLRAASIRAQLKQWARAEELLSLGLHLFPHSNELRSAYAEIENNKAATAQSQLTTEIESPAKVLSCQP